MDKNYSLKEVLVSTFNFGYTNLDKICEYLTYSFICTFVGLILSLMPVILFKNYPEFPIFSNLAIVLILSFVGIILFCVGFYEFILAQYACVLASSDFDKGESVKSRSEYFDIAKKNIKNYINLLLWFCLFGILVFILSVIACAFIFKKFDLTYLATILSMIAILVFYFIFSARVFLVFPIFILDCPDMPLKSFKKSFNLTKGRTMYFIGYTILITIVALILNYFLSLFASILGKIVVIKGQEVGLLSFLLISAVLTFLVMPFEKNISTLLYRKFN